MRQPPCPYYSQCRGCDSQQLEYQEQLERKKFKEYELNSVALLDMFAQTRQGEVAAELQNTPTLFLEPHFAQPNKIISLSSDQA